MGFIIQDVSKKYETQIALDQINLTLSDGTIALLGANGSGKSTLLRILATLTRPDQGNIFWNGLTYPTHQRQLRTQIGYLPQALDFPESFTPYQLLSHLATLRKADLAPIIKQLDLHHIIHHPFRQLSKGQIQLVGIAQAFLGTSRLLLLDEPLQGLDIDQRERVLNLCRRETLSIIFSTHIPAEIEQMNAETLIILKDGKVLFCDTPDKLRDQAKGAIHEVCIPFEDFKRVSEQHLISRAIRKGDWMQVRIVGAFFAQGSKKPVIHPSLEDAYLLLTQPTNRHTFGIDHELNLDIEE